MGRRLQFRQEWRGADIHGERNARRAEAVGEFQHGAGLARRGVPGDQADNFHHFIPPRVELDPIHRHRQAQSIPVGGKAGDPDELRPVTGQPDLGSPFGPGDDSAKDEELRTHGEGRRLDRLRRRLGHGSLRFLERDDRDRLRGYVTADRQRRTVVGTPELESQGYRPWRRLGRGGQTELDLAFSLRPQREPARAGLDPDAFGKTTEERPDGDRLALRDGRLNRHGRFPDCAGLHSRKV